MFYVLLDANGEVEKWPYTLTDLRRDNPDTSFGAEVGEESLAGFRVYPVEPAEAPSVSLIERVAHADPVLIDGVWTQQWAVEPLPLAEAGRALKDAVKSRQVELFQAGWTHEFSVGTYTLDLRDADDKANWHLLLTKTHGMIAAGAGDAPVRIRTANDETFTIPASEANAAMIEFLAWGEDMLAAKWDLDEAIDAAIAAEDAEALAAIDVEAGWP